MDIGLGTQDGEDHRVLKYWKIFLFELSLQNSLCLVITGSVYKQRYKWCISRVIL